MEGIIFSRPNLTILSEDEIEIFYYNIVLINNIFICCIKGSSLKVCQLLLE